MHCHLLFAVNYKRFRLWLVLCCVFRRFWCNTNERTRWEIYVTWLSQHDRINRLAQLSGTILPVT